MEVVPLLEHGTCPKHGNFVGGMCGRTTPGDVSFETDSLAANTYRLNVVRQAEAYTTYTCYYFGDWFLVLAFWFLSVSI